MRCRHCQAATALASCRHDYAAPARFSLPAMMRQAIIFAATPLIYRSSIAMPPAPSHYFE